MRRATTFELGRIVATPGAIDVMRATGTSPLDLLARHAKGDWGNLDDEDQAANDRATVAGARILSAYGEGDAKLWIITEADRSVTTILRPEDYWSECGQFGCSIG